MDRYLDIISSIWFQSSNGEIFNIVLDMNSFFFFLLEISVWMLHCSSYRLSFPWVGSSARWAPLHVQGIRGWMCHCQAAHSAGPCKDGMNSPTSWSHCKWQHPQRSHSILGLTVCWMEVREETECNGYEMSPGNACVWSRGKWGNTKENLSWRRNWLMDGSTEC